GLASVLTLPLMALAVDGPPTDPRQMAVVFGMTLLASWGLLLAGKVWEASRAVKLGRIVPMFVVGSLIGLVGFVLVEATHLGPVRGSAFFRAVLGRPYETWGFGPAGFAVGFGLSFVFFPWWALLGRDRDK